MTLRNFIDFYRYIECISPYVLNEHNLWYHPVNCPILYKSNDFIGEKFLSIKYNKNWYKFIIISCSISSDHNNILEFNILSELNQYSKKIHFNFKSETFVLSNNNNKPHIIFQMLLCVDNSNDILLNFKKKVRKI